MRDVIYCLCCGSPRTFDTNGVYVGFDAYIVCLRCGGDTFTPCRERAPIFPAGVIFTVADRRFLRELRISGA